jgi:hypothetical protein
MRILVLVLGIMLISCNLAVAGDTATQVNPASSADLQAAPPPFTGIIKNKTRYAVSVPSMNSGATLVIPAYSWIEYTAWNQKFDVTVYRHGKPFYCLKISAHPKNYDFMCSKYDFMAEIVKPEPVRKRRIKKKRKCDEGVEALG